MIYFISERNKSKEIFLQLIYTNEQFIQLIDESFVEKKQSIYTRIFRIRIDDTCEHAIARYMTN
jgi:hypothetical protein